MRKNSEKLEKLKYCHAAKSGPAKQPRHGVIPDFKVVGGVVSGYIGQPSVVADAIFNIFWSRDCNDEGTVLHEGSDSIGVRSTDLLACNASWMVF
jgi:hypothetical protein